MTTTLTHTLTHPRTGTVHYSEPALNADREQVPSRRAICGTTIAAVDPRHGTDGVTCTRCQTAARYFDRPETEAPAPFVRPAGREVWAARMATARRR